MHRKWKSVTALSMAVLLGCLMPTNTMLAAEEETEVVQETEADSATDADEVSDEEVISDDNESVDAEVNNIEEENADDEVNIDDDANGGIALMSETDGPEAGDVAVQSAAPVISITLNGESCIDDWDNSNINYKYINYSNPKLKFSASQDNTQVLFCYYLDRNPGDKAKDEIPWPDKSSPMEWTLSNEDTCVLYVKAGEGENTVYARSCGIVVDIEAPTVTGVVDGGIYPEGTTFTVSDANLDVVMVNETPVAPESDGSYRVSANGTSCMIRVKDKAGNEKTCSITVTGREPEENGVISVNGTYSLEAGTPYQLAAGTWQVGGDSTVYQGGRTFYVKSAGNYSFMKR